MNYIYIVIALLVGMLLIFVPIGTDMGLKYSPSGNFSWLSGDRPNLMGIRVNFLAYLVLFSLFLTLIFLQFQQPPFTWVHKAFVVVFLLACVGGTINTYFAISFSTTSAKEWGFYALLGGQVVLTFSSGYLLVRNVFGL